MKKKSNPRESQRHPNLDKRFNLKTRTDLLDQDYLNKLSPEELDWLNKFNKEYVSASLDGKGDLHNTKKLKKTCYDSNNARNRDILTKAKASNQLVDYEVLVEEPGENDYEDYLIQQIDQKDIIDSINWLAEELETDEVELEEKMINELKAKEEP